MRRTWPRADVFDAEPNYFPLVEFGDADLPWRYTPSGDDSGRLTPWLRLIVLSDAELADNLLPATRTKPLRSVRFGAPPSGGTGGAGVPVALLPPADQAWAWAHVDLKDDGTTPEPAPADLYAAHPERFVSRLLCPRRMAPRTAYTAMLVPVFERGRKAGLGEDPTGTTASALAWGASTTSVELPVYFTWRFGTGAEGDFEALVRRLEPRPLPPNVGTREADFRAPGTGLPPASLTPRRLESALQPMGTTPEPWDDSAREEFVAALTPRLNLGGPAGIVRRPGAPALRIVAPPLYGMYPGDRTSVRTDDTGWFGTLNVDPVLRASAGAGAAAVQTNDEALVAAAWRQFEGIRRINEALRFAQVAREAADRIYQRDARTADVDTLFAFATPVLGQVASGTGTLAAALAASPIPTGVLDPQWRKLARPRGPIGLRQGRPTATRRPLLARLNRGELRAAPPPGTPDGMSSLLEIGADLAGAAGDPGDAAGRAMAARSGTPALQLALAIGLAARGLTGNTAPVRWLDDALRGRSGAADISGFASVAPSQPRFVVHADWPHDQTAGAPELLSGGGPDSDGAAAFRKALRDLLSAIGVPAAPAVTRTPIDLGRAASALLIALDPRRTIAASMASRLRLDASVRRGPDPLAPIVAVPDLGIPMYEPLRELSQEWILPGATDVPPNTMTLMKSNQRFIEAFMVGVNHEFARELLWREFPADLRGSFFRQFWDPGLIVPPSDTESERRRDISMMHTWSAASELGRHAVRAVDGNVVLILRGDVLRRYPQTHVYLTLADPTGGGSGTEWQPVLSAELRPEASLRGFEIDERTIHSSPSRGMSYFFVLQEPVAEGRFGLAEPNDRVPAADSRAHLAWDHVGVAGSGYVDLTLDRTSGSAPQPVPERVEGFAWRPTAGATSATLAWLTRRDPVRALVSVNEMLPPDSAEGA